MTDFQLMTIPHHPIDETEQNDVASDENIVPGSDSDDDD